MINQGALLRKILITVAIIVCIILGYGYWHSATHASFYVRINIMSAAQEKAKTIPKTEISFFDAEGRALANGISDAQFNYVHLIHPEVGDCHAIEKLAPFSKEARKSWQTCFEHLSTWIAKWAGEVRKVDLKTSNCAWRNIPVTVSKYNSEWFLWWVPHPHIGGKPYTYYSLSITVAEKDCGG